MKEVITASAARAADQKAIAAGTPSRVLMERAAQGMRALYDFSGTTAIVCGSGNNGGDGYALAKILHREGRCVRLFAVDAPRTPDAQYYHDACVAAGLRAVPFSSGCLAGADTVVDALFGVGLSRPPQGGYADAIGEINQSGAYVISADIPSGLNADNGQYEVCVRADLTAAIGYPKTGEILNGAADVTGKLCTVDIGVRTDAVAAYLFDDAAVRTVIVPRARFCNKGSFGYVALFGGCTCYAGAVKLANLALSALRAGCGVARLCVARSLVPAVTPYLLESTLCPLPDTDGALCYDPDALISAMAGTRAAAVGMGWGSGIDNARILQHMLSSYNGTLIVDADALNALARTDKECLRTAACRVVITPHPGEFSRLCGLTVAQILADPVGTARAFAEQYGVTVLLKGSATVVTDGTETYMVDRGCAGMATAGSGDVLSGVLCGLFGYSTASLPRTAACGAYLAGYAAEQAQARSTAVGMTASDTVAALPTALKSLLQE